MGRTLRRDRCRTGVDPLVAGWIVGCDSHFDHSWRLLPCRCSLSRPTSPEHLRRRRDDRLCNCVEPRPRWGVDSCRGVGAFVSRDAGRSHLRHKDPRRGPALTAWSAKARYCDPATGQFLSVDPGIATTLSPYGYVQGDPLNGADPSGTCGGLLGFICTAWQAATTAGALDQALQGVSTVTQ